LATARIASAASAQSNGRRQLPIGLLFGLGLLLGLVVSIPGSHLIYAVAGLGIFGAFTIVDFNRLRQAGAQSAVAIAASIFLDVFNVGGCFMTDWSAGWSAAWRWSAGGPPSGRESREAAAPSPWWSSLGGER
jgi:hypothetical protein